MPNEPKTIADGWWGVIRFARNRNGDDLAAFDGWYAQREDALLIYEDWRRSFPNWHIALVRQDWAEIAPDLKK